MSPKTQIRDYRPKLTAHARDALMEMASELGFIVVQPGRYFGDPTPPEMLAALAAAYRRDSIAVLGALRSIGVAVEPNPADPADFFSD